MLPSIFMAGFLPERDSPGSRRRAHRPSVMAANRDFRHPGGPGAGGYAARVEAAETPRAGLGARDWRWIGLAVALLAAVPASPEAGDSRLGAWVGLFAGFVALFALLGGEACARWRSAARGAVLGLTAAAALGLVALGGGAFAAVFPVLTAAVAGSMLAPAAAFAFAGAQAAGLAAAFALAGAGPAAALSSALIFGALQLFVVHSAQVARSERSARHELELAQRRLAESSRDAERLRIARELHDVMGHHLTALSLTLEAGAHAPAEDREQALLEAQVLTKRLLRDVRQVVSALREAPVDFEPELRRLAAEARGVRVHLPSFEATPGLAGGEAGRVLLRCAQEAVTNAVRHGGAANLWLELEASAGGLRLVARDDGRPGGPVEPGHGLAGLRERVEELGGRIRWGAAEGGGFRIEAWLPRPPGAGS
jgi:signal transduction histidine kinase